MTVEQQNPGFEDVLLVWDDQALMRTLGRADVDVRQRVLQRFAAHTGEQLRDLNRLCELGDFRAIGVLAHNAKTAARTVGAMQLGHLCDQLESSCAQGDDFLARTQALEVLRAFAAIQDYLPPPTSAS
ncbi:MAG: Hpt domain-containing protein [Rhodoferax sp.]|nr:Hpt domain-containing protein [Rhodoferax sp.]